jgi:Ca-activated chloride channel homolog
MPHVRWIFATAITAAVISVPHVLFGKEETLPPTFQTSVDLVAVTATVQSKDGAFVTNLGADDFDVLENGVPQTISFFGSDEVPVDLILLIDNSASMNARLPAVQHACDILVNALAPHDRAAAVTFGGAIRQQIALTTDHAHVTAAIDRVRAGGATPLYDAIYFALRRLSSRTDEMRRRAVVVLTDGEDTASLMSYGEVHALARESGIAIYTVSLRAMPAVRSQKTMEADYEMHTLTAETGARFLETAEDENLDAAYQSIARELAHQYSIAYVPSSPARTPTSRFTPISILVPGKNVIVRARKGYLMHR